MKSASEPLTHRLKLSDPRLLVLYFIALGYILWPILQVLGESFGARSGAFSIEPWRAFIARGHWRYGLRSLGISVATVALAGLFGTALACVYFRLDFPGRNLLTGLTLLPITLPPLLGVFALWTLMGEEGPFNQITRALLGRGLGFEKGYGGVLLVHTYSMYVFFFVLVGGAISGFDESQLEAARDLGAGRFMTFRRVLLPQLAPAIAGASLLTFMTSMASFTAPYYYLAGRPVLTVGIQQALEEPAPGLASADCVVLAICAGIFLTLTLRFEKTFVSATRGAARERVQIESRPARWCLTAMATALTLILLSPHLALVRESLIQPGTGFIGVPIEYGPGNYRSLWARDESWRPIANSLKASALATGAVVLFALISSWAIARRQFIGKSLLRILVMLPWALPGTVIAIGLLWISRPPYIMTWGLNLRGTLLILALAYFIRLVPLAHRIITAGFAGVPQDLEGAGRDLGASPTRVFLQITLPLIGPAVIAAATLTFVTAMGEFVSSIILHGAGTEPIAVKIDQLRRGPGGMQVASAYSVILTIMIALTFILFGRRGQKAL